MKFVNDYLLCTLAVYVDAIVTPLCAVAPGHNISFCTSEFC